MAGADAFACLPTVAQSPERKHVRAFKRKTLRLGILTHYRALEDSGAWCVCGVCVRVCVWGGVE